MYERLLTLEHSVGDEEGPSILRLEGSRQFLGNLAISSVLPCREASTILPSWAHH